MANKQFVFSDRMVGFSVQNGLVRLDLAVVTGPAKNKDGKAGLKADVTHQLIMPIDAFVAAVGLQQNVVKELVARRKKSKSATDAVVPADTSSAT
mgnify:CR=1 FL=1|jgi:hypothetical protein